MGDDELNFTEEDARGWADDPRNQPVRSGVLASIIVACVLLLIVLVAVFAAQSSSTNQSTSDGEHIQVGMLFVH